MVFLKLLLCGSVYISSSFAVQSIVAESKILHLKTCGKFQGKGRENTFLFIMAKHRFVLALNWYHVLCNVTVSTLYIALSDM